MTATYWEIGRRIVELCEQIQRLIGREDAVTKTGQIARAAAADRQPRQRARHVGRGLQHGANVFARGAVGDKCRDRIKPPRDRGRISERRGEPLCQQA